MSYLVDRPTWLLTDTDQSFPGFVFISEHKKYRCRRKCTVSAVDIDCDTRKSRRLVKDLKGALVAAEMDIEVAPLKTKS